MYFTNSACDNEDDDLAQHASNHMKNGVLYDNGIQNYLFLLDKDILRLIHEKLSMKYKKSVIRTNAVHRRNVDWSYTESTSNIRNFA